MTTVVGWVSEGCSVACCCLFCHANHTALLLCPAALCEHSSIHSHTLPAWLHALCCLFHPWMLHLHRCFTYTPGQSVRWSLHQIYLLCHQLQSWEFQKGIPQPGHGCMGTGEWTCPVITPRGCCAFLVFRYLHSPSLQHGHAGTDASESTGAGPCTDLGRPSAQKSWANVQDPFSMPGQHFQVGKDMPNQCKYAVGLSKRVSQHTTNNSVLFTEK